MLLKRWLLFACKGLFSTFSNSFTEVRLFAVCKEHNRYQIFTLLVWAMLLICQPQVFKVCPSKAERFPLTIEPIKSLRYLFKRRYMTYSLFVEPISANGLPFFVSENGV